MIEAARRIHGWFDRFSHDPVVLALTGFACLQNPVAAVPPEDLYGRSVAYLAMADAFGFLALAYAEHHRQRKGS